MKKKSTITNVLYGSLKSIEKKIKLIQMKKKTWVKLEKMFTIDIFKYCRIFNVYNEKHKLS